ncbi:hypothetical protein CKO38_12050 [Rhodospirillum rubrum]|uniref:helix-turn-helix transcriptional regulator n=1 Tax=Rhodospirillum rubrum TaxID=1085 RepID=UPI001904D495|nr:AraC family transcriptional regulator [Rhodospirillum rubrum]MBK1664311.1 hypothetical protein [Rhodospirillum rubrum]MBK1677387.1 hypothetical protein [Rhodospirillum rubrum]
MIADPPKTEVLRSFYSGFDDGALLFNYRILRGGHIRTGPDHHIARTSVPGHEFLFCRSGAGRVRVENREYGVEAGQLAWIPVHRPHAHWPDARAPWDLLWVRVDGSNLDKLAALLSVSTDPVFAFARPHGVDDLFEALFSHISPDSLLAHASCETLIATLIERLLESRSAPGMDTLLPRHKGLARLIAQIHAHYNDPWDIDALAAQCRVSKSHLFRLFRDTFGQSPLGWLRNYRISQAKRLLVESDLAVAEIARRVGFEDPLHFSRDFRKRVGLAPTVFRERERW